MVDTSPKPRKTEEWRGFQVDGARNRAPVGQLSPQPWMKACATLAVVQALTADNQEVRFVGGCVRDALAKRSDADPDTDPDTDIDIATPDPPHMVLALLERAGLRAIPTGLDHGTVTAISGGRPFEITTLRQDVKTDGRHAQVAWTTDWMNDAARRDFTINALSASPLGAVYDYFDGMQDIAHGRIRFIGRPMDRIREDALRILRFFRFHGLYGRGRPDSDGLEACRSQVNTLLDLSKDRIRGELFKILASPAATDMMLEMQGVRILQTLLPELGDIGRLRQLVFLETRGIRLKGVSRDPIRRLGAMIVGGADAALTVAHRLRLSNAQTKQLVTMSADRTPPPDEKDRVFHQLLRSVGRQGMVDRLMLTWAGDRATNTHGRCGMSAAYIHRLQEIIAWDEPVFPVQGRDLLALGVRPGPHLGRLLRCAEQWWENHDYQPDREAVLAHISAVFQTSEGRFP